MLRDERSLTGERVNGRGSEGAGAGPEAESCPREGDRPPASRFDLAALDEGGAA